MKKKFALGLAALAIGGSIAGVALADDYVYKAIYVTQVAEDGQNQTDDWLAPVTGTSKWAMGLDEASGEAVRWQFGSGLTATKTGDKVGVITATAPSITQSTDSRSLNTCFQVSSTANANVHYSVDIAATLSLTTGQKGTVYLETYTDSGCSSGTLELGRFSNGNSGTLALGLGLTQTVTGNLSGYVPAGRYVKLRTVNDTGSPTFTFQSGVKEVQ